MSTELEAKYEAIGLVENLVTISINGIVVVENEIKGTMASLTYIQGFIKAYEMLHPEVNIKNLGEVK